jgi:vacuolar-type H+-ATPase catalytic subunit A/Vma1
MPLMPGLALLVATLDEQLDTALRHLEERIREQPIEELPPAAFPRRAVE